MVKNTATTNGEAFIRKAKNSKRFSFLPDSYVSQRRLCRKELQNDILDTHVLCFDQPSVPHRPRLLLFNVEKSYLSKRPDLYKGPRRKMTPDVTRSNSSQVTKLPIKRNRHSPKNSSINLPRLPKQHAKENKTSTVQRRKDFILTDKEKVDFLSWSFMKDLTSNLVNTSMLSDTFAVQLCDKVIQKWATNLSQSRLFMLTGKILLETGIGIDGLLSKFDPQFVDRMTHTDSEDKDVDNDEHENEVDPPGNHVAETSNDSEIHENYDENQSQYEDDHTDDQVESQHSTFREPNPKIEESRQKERKRWSTSVQNEQCLKGKVRGANFDEELREESVQVKEDILNQDQDYCVVGSTSSSYKGRSSEKSKRVALATVGRMLDDLILDDKI